MAGLPLTWLLSAQQRGSLQPESEGGREVRWPSSTWTAGGETEAAQPRETLNGGHTLLRLILVPLTTDSAALGKAGSL